MGSGISTKNKIVITFKMGSMENQDIIIRDLMEDPDKSNYGLRFVSNIFGGGDRTTILCHSVHWDYDLVFNHLIESHYDILINDRGHYTGLTALDIACRQGKHNHAVRLIKRGAIVHKVDNPLIYNPHDLKLLEMLLLRGYNIDEHRITRLNPPTHQTALSVAIENKNKDLVLKLLSYGADPNICLPNHQMKISFFKSEERSTTPLELAIRGKHNGIIEIMLNTTTEHPNKVQLRNNLKSAQWTREEEIMRLILGRYYKNYCEIPLRHMTKNLMTDKKSEPEEIILEWFKSYEGCILGTKNCNKSNINVCCKKTLILIIMILRRWKMYYDIYERILRYV